MGHEIHLAYFSAQQCISSLSKQPAFGLSRFVFQSRQLSNQPREGGVQITPRMADGLAGRRLTHGVARGVQRMLGRRVEITLGQLFAKCLTGTIPRESGHHCG